MACELQIVCPIHSPPSLFYSRNARISLTSLNILNTGLVKPYLSQHSPTTSDLRAILQKCGYSRSLPTKLCIKQQIHKIKNGK